MDIKFPVCILPHQSMKDPHVSWQQAKQVIPGSTKPNTVTILLRRVALTSSHCSEVQNAVHKRVADLFSWSMGCAAEGSWPMTGIDGEPLDPKSLRFQKRGQSLAGGWRQGSTFKCPLK